MQKVADVPFWTAALPCKVCRDLLLLGSLHKGAHQALPYHPSESIII